MMNQSSPSLKSLRRTQAAGLAAVLVLVGGVIAWGGTAEIAGAVIAPAQVVVKSNPKKVQHLEGGIVLELQVRNGDRVSAGDLLIRLDDVETRANLSTIQAQLDELMAEEARLAAERDDAETVSPTGDLARRADDPAFADILEGQISLLTSRRQALLGQKAQLREQVTQSERQITGLQAQLASKVRQRELAQAELADLQSLREKGLVEKPRLIALEREIASFDGEAGQIEAEIARTTGAISETELKIIQLEDERRSQALAELAETRARSAELAEQKAAAEARLRRMAIVAPQSGTVHELAVHTIGGVIAAGEPAMLIVPDGEELVIRARIDPADVDQLFIGSSARLRFPGFHQRTTPELLGTVAVVSADVTVDPSTGAAYYLAELQVGAGELEKLNELVLRPGMPAEALIATGDRTALSYLFKPLADQIEHAFRE